MRPIEVLAVASEYYPLAKTGGLADVIGALPAALAGQGVSVRTLIPGYPAVLAALRPARVVHDYPTLIGRPARILEATAEDGAGLFVLDAPGVFDRPGALYADARGADWPDTAQRFAALARAGADLGLGLLAAYRPDIVHAHDWQAGLTPAYLAYAQARRPGTVMTVHNLAFQGQFDRGLLTELGLPPESFTPDDVEYYGFVGYLKAGLRFADRLTTVSPTYAAEILSPDAGMGLDGLLRGRGDRLRGILNGLDTRVWDPAQDPLIVSPFDAEHLERRAANTEALRQRFGLEARPQAPLLAVVSRLSWQKGLDLLLAALPTLLAEGCQLLLLGSGDADLRDGFQAAAVAHPGRIACQIGYDEGLAHQIQAGADVIVVPSRFEPCGLTQLCALRYGAVPLVARVGGLADTVIDASPMALAAGVATGVQFAPPTVAMLETAIRRVAALFRDQEAWARIKANGMSADVSWAAPARAYAALYRGLMAERAAGPAA